MPRKRFHIVFDPFDLIIEIAHDLFPGVRAEIMFSAESRRKKGVREFGATIFDRKIPCITIASDTPVCRAPEILAHEIAHVVVGIRAGHGKKWERVFARIHREYERRITRIAKEQGLTAKKPPTKKG